ncbi:MAG: hypothetical protein WC150_15220 [Bacteroidia bacterium]
MNTVKESFVIIFSFAFIFIVLNTPLYAYKIPVLGFLIFFSALYLVFKRRKRKGTDLFIGSYPEIASIIICLVLAISITGGIQSNLFFLLYFLLFGIAFLFEPVIIFVFVLGIGAIFLQDALLNDVFNNFIKLGSVLLLSPIAFFFSKELKNRENERRAIDEQTEIILEDAEDLRSRLGSKSPEEEEDIDEIIETASELKKGY